MNPRAELRLLVLVGLLVGPGGALAASPDEAPAERRRSWAVGAVRGPGPGLERPECDPATKIICGAEATATRPSCDGFVGDPMFLWVNHMGTGVIYCRRRTPPSDHDSWLAQHPESCRPGETRHACLVLHSFRKAQERRRSAGASEEPCPEYDSKPEYYRVYPLNAHGGHKGLSSRPGEFSPYNQRQSERFYCRRLEAIKAEEALAQRRAGEVFRRGLARKTLIALGALAALGIARAVFRRA